MSQDSAPIYFPIYVDRILELQNAHYCRVELVDFFTQSCDGIKRASFLGEILVRLKENRHGLGKQSNIGGLLFKPCQSLGIYAFIILKSVFVPVPCLRRAISVEEEYDAAGAEVVLGDDDDDGEGWLATHGVQG